MANHSFNITLADRYGIEGSILIEHLYWWIHKNECEEEETMTKNGRVWCYSSAKGFNRYIPYMTPKKIWRELKQLEERGVLITGNFNTKPTNQTLWYSFSNEFQEEMISLGYDFPKMENAISKNGKSNNIINNNNLIENNIIEDKKRLSNDNQKDNLDFDSFYKLYPRKRSRLTAEKAWKKLSVKDRKEAIEKLPVYIADCAECKREVKYPATYLNQRTWEDDFTNDGKSSKEESEEAQYDLWQRQQEWFRKNVPNISNYITRDVFRQMRKICIVQWAFQQVLVKMNDGFDGDFLEAFKKEVKLCTGG